MEGATIKILMFVSNNYHTDPRVKREADTLEDNGHDVTVFHWNRKGQASTPTRIFRWQRTAYRKTKNMKVDAVHCHDFDTLRVGVKLKKRNGCKLIYDSHEMWSYMVADMHSSISKISDILERRWLKHVDKIITVDEGTTKYIKARTDKPVVKVENCKEIISKRYKPTNNGNFTVSYFGTLDNDRMFPELVDIIGGMDDVNFVIGGIGVEYKSVERKSKKYPNVSFLGTLTETNMMSWMKDSDAIICMFNPNNLNKRYGIPNKFYESLVCGRPLICTWDTSLGDLVSKLDCGVCSKYNKDSIQWIIKSLQNDREYYCEYLGRNALKQAIKNYNWDLEKQKLLEVYN